MLPSGPDTHTHAADAANRAAAPVQAQKVIDAAKCRGDQAKDFVDGTAGAVMQHYRVSAIRRAGVQVDAPPQGCGACAA